MGSADLLGKGSHADVLATRFRSFVSSAYRTSCPFGSRGRDHETEARRLPGGPVFEDAARRRWANSIRNYLSLTLSFNHDLNDGAQAARFTEWLKELIESSYGLDESTVASELVGAEAAAKKS